MWAASLLWDRIYRIVPSGYKPDDAENVRILTEAGEIGMPIHPDQYSRTVADDFIKRLENGEWTAAALETEIPEEYARLHKDKVDVKLRELIIAKGGGAAHEEWLYVPTQFEALYMTYLANHIANANKLQLLSDSAAAWTGSTYFRYAGDVQDYPSKEYVQQLAVLVLRDFYQRICYRYRLTRCLSLERNIGPRDNASSRQCGRVRMICRRVPTLR